MSFIPFNDPALARMHNLAGVRRLECDRTTGERAEVQVYKVSSHSQPGHWHTVLLYDKDEKASCTCQAKDACSHIALALSDLRPHFISEWAGGWREDLRDELVEMRQGQFRRGARQRIEKFRQSRGLLVKPEPAPYVCPEYLRVPAGERAEETV